MSRVSGLSRLGWRGGVCALVGSALVVSSLVAGSARSMAVPQGPAGPGRWVVSGLTSPVQQVWQNSDGTRTVELSSVPVRVKRSGGWVDVDPSLSVDGSVLRPVAVLSDVVFSAGGSGPLVSYRSGGTALDLSWPSVLPVPVVEGDTATYPDVAAGVDLRVTALADGFSEALVVKTRAAASASVVRHPSFGVRVTGGSLSTSSGGLVLRDSAGAVVFRGGSASMWDVPAVSVPVVSARGVTASPAAGEVLPDGGSVANGLVAAPVGSAQAAVGVRVDADSVDLVPATGLLDDPSTVFPVVIDPAVSGPSAATWGMVTSAFPNSASYKWSGADEGVGYQNFESPTLTKRLFFSFGLSQVAGTKIVSAQFKAKETWSAGCSPYEVDLWQIGSFGSATTWNAQPSWKTKVDWRSVAYGNPSCSSATNVSPNDTWVEYNAYTPITALAASNASVGYFGLRVASENNSMAWKRFASGAQLSITFDHAPSTPTSLSLLSNTGAALGCGSSGSPTLINSPFSLQAVMKDPDSGDQLTAGFQYWSTAGVSMSYHPVGPRAQGTFTSAFVLPDTVKWGETYKWQAWSTDSTGLSSAKTAWCYFKIDLSAPNPPGVSLSLNGTTYPSSSDPEQPVTVPVGTGLSFTFTPGSSDTVKYKWSVNGDTPGPDTLTGSTVTTQITVNSSGPNVLRVWGYDGIGNRSSPNEYYLQTAGDITPVRWSLDESTSPSAPDAACTASGVGPAASPVTWAPPGVVSNSPSMIGNGLSLSSGAAVTTGTAPVASSTGQQSANATVTAWVHVDPAALDMSGFTNRTVLSVDAATGTALQVLLTSDQGTPRFAAALGKASGSASAPTVTDTVTNVSTDYWYQVAVTVNYQDHAIALFVSTYDPSFGDLTTQGTSVSWQGSDVVPAVMSGVQRLGASRTAAGALTGQWLGQVDEVRDFRAGFDLPEGSVAPPSALAYWFTNFETEPCA